MTIGQHKIISEKETGNEARQRALCDMKVKQYKIKNRLCIHDDQQF